MKLNPDCVRDILLWLEENQEMEQGWDGALTGYVKNYVSTDIPQYIENHSGADVLYSINQMIKSGLLSGKDMRIDGAAIYLITDITPKGHEFLGNIRTEENWKKTKGIASKVGAVTLTAISQISARIIAEAIKQNI